MELLETWLAPTLGAILAIAFLSLRAWQKSQRHITVQPWEHGLMFQDGAFLHAMPPGRYRDTNRRSARIYTTIPQSQAIQPQEALTADRFQLRLSALVTHRIPPNQVQQVLMADLASPEERVRLATTQALRRIIAAHPLDDLLGPRDALDADLIAQLRAAPTLAGIEITAAETRDLILAAEVRRMLTEAERSRRESLAALERARGEQAVLRSLANSARMIKGNPALMNLRLLHALQPAPGKGRPTIVLGGGAGLVPIAPDEAAAQEANKEDSASFFKKKQKLLSNGTRGPCSGLEGHLL